MLEHSDYIIYDHASNDGDPLLLLENDLIVHSNPGV